MKRVAIAALVLVACSPDPRVASPTSGAETLEDTRSLADRASSDIERYDLIQATLHRAIEQAGAPRSFVQCDSLCRYERSRLASGGLVLDIAQADALLAALRDHTPSTTGRFLHPATDAPLGTACGSNADCDDELFCAPTGHACERTGRCVERLQLDAVCPLGAADPCAHGGDGAQYICLGSMVHETEGRCRRVVFDGRARAAGERCRDEVLDTLMMGAPLPTSTTLEILRCAPGHVCEHGVCEPRPARAQAHEDCRDRRCEDGLRCGSVGRCVPAVGSCDVNGCGWAEGFACVGGECVETDGGRGAPCTLVAGVSSCQVGLACGDDGRCGEPLPLGAPADYDCNSCASGCCSAARDSVCIAPAAW